MSIKTLSAEDIHYAIVDRLRAGVPHIDAIIEYAEKNDLEIAHVAEIIKRSPVFKSKVFEEAKARNLIKVEHSTLTEIE